MGRGPVFQRQLPRRGHLSRQGPESSPTYAVLAILSNGCPPQEGRLPTCYAPVRHFTRGPKPSFSFDLHVLSPPLTFALSQDQPLQLNQKRVRFLQHALSTVEPGVSGQLFPVAEPHLAFHYSYRKLKVFRVGLDASEETFRPTFLGLLFSFQRPTSLRFRSVSCPARAG